MSTEKLNVFKHHEYKDILIQEYQNRVKQSPSYSMRTFSQELGLRNTALNDVLNGRYGLSALSAKKIAQYLGLDENESEYFICLVEKKHARSSIAKKAAQLRLAKYRKHPAFQQLEDDSIEIISRWYYMAILELITVYKGRLSIEQCAKSLGLSIFEIENAFERLQRRGLVSKVQNKWVRNLDYYEAAGPAPTSAIRGFHKQILQLAMNAIETQKVEERTLLSTILSLNTKSLKAAAEYLSSVQDDFIGKFEDSREADSVYGLSFQLFRVDGSRS